VVKKRNNEETSFEDMLAMLRKKVQEKDDEIKRLQEENAKLKEALPEGVVLDETFKRR
jgi:predicted  nucleic acid-binding Zn-ribbon protein